MSLTRMIFFCLCVPILGNTQGMTNTVLVVDPRTNQNAFEVVLHDSGGGARNGHSPGIYSVSRTSDGAKPVALGNVLGINRAFNGFIYQEASDSLLSGTGLNFAVVDGRLSAFNRNNDARDTKKRPLLLGDTNWLLMDPFTARRVNAIRPIGSIDDVAVVRSHHVSPLPELPNGGIVYLVSFRQEHNFGSGFTAAFLFERPVKENALPKLFHNRSLIVSYDYLNEDKLKQLVQRSGVKARPFVYSSLAIDATINRFSQQTERDPSLNLWLSYLTNFKRSVENAGKNIPAPIINTVNVKSVMASMLAGVPQIDLLSGSVTFDSIPFFKLEDGAKGIQTGLNQVFDPRQGRWYFTKFDMQDSQHPALSKFGKKREDSISFVQSSVMDARLATREIDGQLLVEGKVDRDSAGRHKISPVISSNGDGAIEQGYQMIVGQAIVFLVPSAMTGSLTALTLPMSDYNDFKSMESKHQIIKTGSGIIAHFIMVSILQKTGKKNFYVVQAEEDTFGRVKIQKINNIDATYFSSDELGLRTQVIKEIGREGVFIDLEKPIKGASYYRENALKKGRGLAAKAATGSSASGGDDDEPDLRQMGMYNFFPADLNRNSVVEQKAYLRAASIESAVGDGLVSYVRFNSNSADQMDRNRSGFYIDFKDIVGEVSPERLHFKKPLFVEQNQNFIAGHPLYLSKHKESPMAIDSLTIPDGGLTLKLSVVPFHKDAVVQPNVNGFQLLLVLGASTMNGKKKTTYTKLSIPEPFGALTSSKIVRGLRNRSDHLHLLLFFGKEGQSSAGVYTISLRVDSSYAGAEREVNLMVTQEGAVLHRGIVSPSEVNSRLKATPEGALYWIDNPQEGPESHALKVKSLLDPKTVVYVNRASEHRVSLRHNEMIEGSKGSVDFSSQWHIIIKKDLQLRFPWFDEYIKDRTKWVSDNVKNSKKKAAYFDDYEVEYSAGYNSYGEGRWLQGHEQVSQEFNQFLESLALQKTSTSPQQEQSKTAGPKKQIVLVEDRLKDAYLKDILTTLWAGKGAFKVTTSGTSMFNFYAFDVNSTVQEAQVEYALIRRTSPVARNLLFATIGDLNRASSLVLEDGDGNKEDSNENSASDKESEVSDNTEVSTHENGLSRWLILASGGQFFDLNKLRKRLSSSSENDSFSTLIIGTPSELAAARQANPDAVRAGVFDQFQINYEFLTSSWKMWAPNTKFTSAKINEHARASVTDEEEKVFPDIERLFGAAARGELRGQQINLVVSKELKPLVQKIISTKWAMLNRQSESDWHHSNDKLVHYTVAGGRDDNTQEKVFENFQAMRGSAEKRNVVFVADLEDVQKVGRPFNPERPGFKLKDPLSLGTGSRGEWLSLEQGENTSPKESSADVTTRIAEFQKMREARVKLVTGGGQNSEIAKRELSAIDAEIKRLTDSSGQNATEAFPHLMWLIATEGQRIQPKSEASWNLKEAASRKLATILIGTPEEWGAIEQDLTFESRYLDINSHFTSFELNAPSERIKVDLVRALFRRPEIQSLSYRFVIDSKVNEDAERQLIAHFVNRVEQIANQQRLEPTAAFIRAFSELRRTVIEDTSLRRSRTIDKRFLERLFFKIFPLPINLENLESDDPLLRLSNLTQAARNLQTLGYHGAMPLKERTLATVLSQTRGGDAGRPIPNSQIFFGGTSSGKTFLFKKIVEMLGLVAYNPNKSNNENANYIIIPVQNLVPESKDGNGAKDPNKMTVDDAIELIEDLISQPNGHRAFILFDDAHKTSSKEVHQKLFSYIQGLFEAPNGVIRVRRKGAKGEQKEVPVQNLGIYMTVNPTANKHQLEKFADGGDLKKLVLAALAGHGVDMEESFLARWSDIINLDSFPRGAKVPALVERVRVQSTSASSTVLVDPGAIEAMVNRFPSANAREFLRPAASALTRVPDAAERGPLYIVTPQKKVETTKAEIPASAAFLSQPDLVNATRQLTQIDPVSFEKADSVVKLMIFLMGNFRNHLFNSIVLTAQNTEELRLEMPGQSSVLKRNFVLAAMTHLLKNPEIPFSEVRLPGSDFTYLGPLQLEELVDIQANERSSKSYFPFPIGVNEHFSPINTDGFLSSSQVMVEKLRSRETVINETVIKIEVILKRMLRLYLRQNNNDLRHALTWDRSDIVSWFESLNSKTYDEEYGRLVLEVVRVYKEFLGDFHMEKLGNDTGWVGGAFSMYDNGRIYAYIIDKAIASLPWGVMSKFVVDITREAGDLSLGQKPSYINYAQEHIVSPLAIVTNDFMNESIMNEAKSEQEVSTLDRRFHSICEMLLSE